MRQAFATDLVFVERGVGRQGDVIFVVWECRDGPIKAPLAGPLQAFHADAPEVLHLEAPDIPDVTHIPPLLFAVLVQEHIVHLVVKGHL